MRSELKDIKKENEFYLDTLPSEDIDGINDMMQYISLYNANVKDNEILKKDLIQIALDAKSRGESFSKAIGDKEDFARSLAANTKNKPYIMTVINLLYKFTLVLAIYSAIMVFGGLTPEKMDGKIGFTIGQLCGLVLFYAIFAIYSVKIAPYLRVVKGKNKKQTTGYELIMILIAAAILFLTDYLVSLIAPGMVIHITALPLIFVLLVLSFVLYMIKNNISIKGEYKAN